MKNTGFSEITEERLQYRGNDPWYLEVSVTGRCNFNCRYCNRFNCEIDINILENFLKSTVQLKHIQVTGGEPTVHDDFDTIVKLCRKHTQKLGLSTNGSADLDKYLSCPADMFSISLDDYDLDILEKRGYKNPQHVVHVIKELSKSKYVNVGLYVDALNFTRVEEIVDYILSLGAHDVKISTALGLLPVFIKDYDEKHPILHYRVVNFKNGLPMRGRPAEHCHIIGNDITIVGEQHYPCLVYFREHGAAIGNVTDWETMRIERENWIDRTDCTKDNICKRYCMDFKCEFNSSF